MYRLPDIQSPLDFPDDFTTTPEGLLALGGNLHPQTLTNAYSKGIFPWFNEGDPILWWHPNPRSVIFPENVHISRKMRRFFKKTRLFSFKSKNEKALLLKGLDIFPSYVVTINQDFEQTLFECRDKRGPDRDGTWITPHMTQAYISLHKQQLAHSIEVWNSDNELVGGMYGVCLGDIFFGESMFSHESNTSKLALVWLCDFMKTNNMTLLDCQVESDHLLTLGAQAIPRKTFLKYLHEGETRKLQSHPAFLNFNSTPSIHEPHL